MSSTDEELDLSEIDVFATRKRKAEPKSQVPACATVNTPGTTVVRMEEKLAIASLEASSLRRRNKRSRSEQRRLARMRRQQTSATTELESLVEAAIADGDFEKAEMLSDHLANRQFAVKIADAFAAKRCAEEQEAKRRRDYVKRQAKLPWGFEAKERWQMKGNM
ncbi:uncharacterized protein LOC119174085 isoform X2 [Rhipicephalus microplus]|uniref:uncharacterized protein LOC119174085 isoform X2 n=1 Tax=Rhipicephalus microplus TaxID=6941 RepID=UPI0018895B81|nr:protein FAM204A-like isoform X2 [Rhipicephalus microplus]